MQTHDKTAMLAEILVPLSLHYPQAGYSPAQLSALADDWCEDLAAYPLAIVKAAVAMARRKEVFFPSVAVVTQYAQLAQRERAARVPQIAADTGSPDAVRKSAICSAMLARSMGGDTRAKEFFRLPDWVQKDGVAREVLGDAYPAGGVRA